MQKKFYFLQFLVVNLKFQFQIRKCNAIKMVMLKGSKIPSKQFLDEIYDIY